MKIGFGRKRAPREGVQLRQLYPEWVFITNRPRLAYITRALRGRPLDGVRWTNSTFLHPATEGEDSGWLRLAGWHRSLIWLCSIYVLLLLLPAAGLLLLFGQEQLLLQLLHLHLAASAPVLLLLDQYFRVEHGVRLPLLVSELDGDLDSGEELPERRVLRMVWVREGRRTWREEVLEPLALALAEPLDSPYRPSQVEQWIDVPRDYQEPGHPVEIRLPRGFAPVEAKQKKIVSTIRSKLGMLESTEQWLLQGRHPRLLLSAPPAPPALALFADYREQLLKMSTEYSPVLGVVSSGELLAAEMVNDSPHIAVSAGSGAGKSKLLQGPIAQALWWGWSVVILDWKVESHEWARGLPGVTYVSDVQAIHEMLERLGQEVDIRKALSPEQRALRPRVLVVAEEWNVTATKLMDYWTELRAQAEPDEKRTMPLKSPALIGMQDVEFAGRAFGMFVALVAQRMSNRVFNGNVDRRENYMIRCLARYTTQTWKMLLPHLKYMRKPTQLGRWVIASGDQACYAQGILYTDEEARELAMSGQQNAGSPFASIGPGRDAGQPGAQLLDEATEQGILLPLEAAEGSEADNPLLDYLPRTGAPMILRKLVDISSTLADDGVTEKMLRNWRDTEDSFPEWRGGSQNRGYLYDLNEVRMWVRKYLAARYVEQKSKARKG
jgi:hypothetical protein